MSLAPGSRLGVFQLQERIGAGGMGEVYRARDTRLGRDVAIKVLPAALAADRDRLARLEREAQVLASLNHPNVATIHGLEESGGALALVMELVEGDTLAERLARGALPLDEALTVARQIAYALEAAHDRGVVHRDLKPANVKLTPDRIVKVLDFGLAKGIAVDVASVDFSQRETLPPELTREGVLAGTPAYMSPEQARGSAVDKRTDIWAFGVVLYEMLAGRAAFARATVPATLNAVVDEEPDWQAIPSTVPPTIVRLLRKCLTRDVTRRLRDIGDARLEIEDVAATTVASAPQTASHAQREGVPRATGRLLWTAGGFFAAAAIAAAVALFFENRAAPVDRPAQFTLSFAGQMTDIAAASMPIPSPDARFFVFVGTDEGGVSSLWIRPVDSSDARPLPGTAGGQTPFWSPDGRWIGFFADDRLKKISPSGGQPQTIAALTGFQDPAWSPSGNIVFRLSNRQPLVRISESGGTPTPLTRLNAALAENSHRAPAFLPDGRRFLFTSRCGAPENNALYIGSLDSSDVRRLMPIASKAIYVPAPNGGPGSLLYYREGGLEARAFDPQSEQLLGDPQPVIASVDYNAPSIAAFFQASRDGRLIVVRPARAGDTQLTWFNRDGEQTGALGAPGNISQPRLSPGGDRVSFSRPDEKTGNRDIWTIEVARGFAAPLTLHPANDWNGVWAPDGARLVFSSDRDGGPDSFLYIKQSIDASAAESRLNDPPSGGPTDWSRDGLWISYESLMIASATTNRAPFQFLSTPFHNAGGRFSPDGKWLAYTSNETGRTEVYVRPFAGAPAATEGRIQLSAGGGDFPVWRADGQELYFMSGDFTIHAVTTRDLHRTDQVPAPQRLFRGCPGTVPQAQPMSGQWYGHPFDTMDGTRFLVNCAAHPPGQFVVLMNWSRGE